MKIFLSLVAALVSPLALAAVALAAPRVVKLETLSVTVDGSNVVIRPTKGDSVESHQVFALDAPWRIVIDLPNVRVARNSEIDLTGQAPLKKIRIGRHTDKTRLVLDSDGSEPDYRASFTAGALRIELTPRSMTPPEQHQSSPPVLETPIAQPSAAIPADNAAKLPETPPAAHGNEIAKDRGLPRVRVLRSHRGRNRAAAEQAAPLAESALAIPQQDLPTTAPEVSPSIETALAPSVETPAASPLESSAPLATSPSEPQPAEPPVIETTAPTVPPHTVPTATSLPSRPPAPIPTTQDAAAQRISVSPGQALIRSVLFDYTGPTREPVTRIVLSKKVEYTLTKVDQLSYRLVLSGAAPESSALTLHQFPPHDFLGLSYIQAAQKGANTEITVGVDQGIKISAFTKDSEVWIKVISR